MSSFGKVVRGACAMLCRNYTKTLTQCEFNGTRKFKKVVSPLTAAYQTRSIHTSSQRLGLEEFLDDEDNWGAEEVKTGRPWRKEELRLKSNTDLHKLWYVLLKERNVIMTMEAEYDRCYETFPAPERLEKVEESMENLLDVVNERDHAVHMLETGEPEHPEKRWAYNELGQGYWHRCKEHYVPMHMNNQLKNRVALNGKWQYRFKRQWREQQQNKAYRYQKLKEQEESKLRELFPDEDFD